MAKVPLTLEQVEAAGGYSVIYADPPWSYKDKGRKEAFARYRGVANHYDTMDVEAIKALPVARLAAKNCALFCWAVSPLIAEALSVIAAWGFVYKTVGFAWVKVNKGDKVERAGQPRMGLGRWTRSSMELCLLATKGSPKRIDAGVHQTILEDAEDTLLAPLDRLRHSEKPAEARDRIVRLLGDLPRIELFRARKG